MLIINNCFVEHSFNFNNVLPFVAKYLNLKPQNIKSAKLHKRSIDARNKRKVQFCCSFLVELGTYEDEFLNKTHLKNVTKYNKKEYTVPSLKLKSDCRPVIVGFGPCGIFAALLLSEVGLNPIVIERGAKMEDRITHVNSFFAGGDLNPNSNIQFGEGGAGTFSDGKLTTGIGDERINFVLNAFWECGADESILYNAKAHIGTDKLRTVIKNLRERIIKNGGEIRFNTTFCDYHTQGGALRAVTVKTPSGTEVINTSTLILAIGHSSRDTYKLLKDKGLNLIAKPFSVGARIEHKQEWLNLQQLGDFANCKEFTPIDYKLSCHLKNGRGVYTFCMCPGGVVVNASSEKGQIVTNGMSNFARDGENCNSALLVGVTPDDFEGDDVLRGMYFQEKIEKRAYEVAGGYYAPAQKVGDFLCRTPTTSLGSIKPTFLSRVSLGSIDDCLPEFVTDSMREALSVFDKKIKGFKNNDAILTAPETRSSAPVRIIRDENFESSISGIYPAGEGAGYAGGIMSSAVDGLKVAEKIIERTNML